MPEVNAEEQAFAEMAQRDFLTIQPLFLYWLQDLTVGTEEMEWEPAVILLKYHPPEIIEALTQQTGGPPFPLGLHKGRRLSKALREESFAHWREALKVPVANLAAHVIVASHDGKHSMLFQWPRAGS